MPHFTTKNALIDVPTFREVGRPGKAASAIVKRTRKPLSAEGKARIAAAQNKRWAKARKATSARAASRKLLEWKPDSERDGHYLKMRFDYKQRQLMLSVEVS